MSEPKIGISEKEMKTVAITGLISITTFLGFGGTMFVAAAQNWGAANMLAAAAIGLSLLTISLYRMSKL